MRQSWIKPQLSPLNPCIEWTSHIPRDFLCALEYLSLQISRNNDSRVRSFFYAIGNCFIHNWPSSLSADYHFISLAQAFVQIRPNQQIHTFSSDPQPHLLNSIKSSCGHSCLTSLGYSGLFDRDSHRDQENLILFGIYSIIILNKLILDNFFNSLWF